MQSKRKTKTGYVENDDYLNGVPKSEWSPPWTEEERMLFKDALEDLKNAGKLTKGKRKSIRSNMELALDELVEYHSDFADYRDTNGGSWKERKYQALYTITRHFTDKNMGIEAGEALSQVPAMPEAEENEPGFSQPSDCSQKTASPDSKLVIGSSPKTQPIMASHLTQDGLPSQVNLSFNQTSPVGLSNTKEPSFIGHTGTLEDLLDYSDFP